MKSYIIRTKRVAYFLYNVNAEDIDQAEQAALAMMDSEEWMDRHTNMMDIEYEHEIDKSGKFDPDNDDFNFPNNYGISAAKVLDLYGDGGHPQSCADVQDYINSKVKGETA